MRLILADDDETTRPLLEEWLQALGYQVAAVADGRAAWVEFARAAAPILVLHQATTQAPPKVDALELCRRLRAEGGEAGRCAFIIVVTAAPVDAADAAAADRDAPARALEAGADDFLSAPVTQDVLRARLAVARRRMDQESARRRAEAALGRAQLLAGIGETTLALQHEINNPLAALLGNAILLEQGLYANDVEREACLQVIVEQAKRIAAVVKRLSALRDARTAGLVGKK